MVLIDMSTISPTVAQKVTAEHDCPMLDAPVLGGDVGAEKGTLSIMVGGDATTSHPASASACTART